MNNVFKASERASKIEYAIRDVVVPADELEKNGHEIIKLNLGDPLASVSYTHLRAHET